MKKNLFVPVILFAVISLTNLSCSKASDEEISRDITITDTGFNSSVFMVQKTRTVVWANLGTMNHSIISDTGTELNSSAIIPGKTFPHTFNTAGTFNYHCGIHPSETGTIMVHP